MSNGNKSLKNLFTKTNIYIGIIVVFLIVLAFKDQTLIIPSFVVLFLSILYAVIDNKERKTEDLEKLNDLILNLDEVAKNTLVNGPTPLTVFKVNGGLLWRNPKFDAEFEGVEMIPILEEITKEVKAMMIENPKQEKYEFDNKLVEIKNKEYNILGECIQSITSKKVKEYIITAYFIDNTEKNEIKKELEKTKIGIGIVVIDNYEEIIQRISNEDKPRVIAEVEKNVYEWLAPTTGVVAKLDRDRFIFLFEQKYLEEIEENKFKVLDTVKDIKIDDKSQVTLSISFALDGETEYEKYKFALAGIDVVLGRGGDQAIIRKQGKYTFFGGRTLEIEKRTKVKARIIASALKELIVEAKDVIIMGHTNPDIDSIGSSLGIYRLAKTLGKNAYVVNNKTGLTLEKFTEELEKDEEYTEAIITNTEAINKISKDTLLVIVDTHIKSYIEEPKLLDETEKIVIIDHHRRSTDDIKNPILMFHEVYASSAAELVTEIIQYSDLKIELKEIEVQGLYAGIMVDTKNFTFKTGVRTFEAAAYLRKMGIDIVKIKKWFQSDLDSYNKIANIVMNAEIVNESIGIAEYKEVDKNAQLICAKAADELLSISDITASFVLGDLGDKICISGRSIGDINVQIILEKLGGGGHITVAGAQLANMNMEEAKHELIIRINEYFTEIL